MTPEVYWVRDIEPLRLAIMPRPRGGDWLADEITGWRRLDISIVVSLLTAEEMDELSITEEPNLCRANQIDYRSFPVQDRGVPTDASTYLAMVDDLVKLAREGRTVAVHCRAGIGRSGLTAACILFRLGIPAADIFPMLSRARGLVVPDTTSQIDWFRSFEHVHVPLSY